MSAETIIYLEPSITNIKPRTNTPGNQDILQEPGVITFGIKEGEVNVSICCQGGVG